MAKIRASAWYADCKRATRAHNQSFGVNAIVSLSLLATIITYVIAGSP